MVQRQEHNRSYSRSPYSRSRTESRAGIAATETAILLPTFVIIVFAAIECSNALFLQQSITIAAYEAGTILADPSGTEAAAELKCEEILSARDIQSFTLVVTTTSTLASLQPGDTIQVEVVAPASAYSIGPGWFFNGRNLRATVYMARTS